MPETALGHNGIGDDSLPGASPDELEPFDDSDHSDHESEDLDGLPYTRKPKRTVSRQEDFELYTPDEERAVRHKLDFRLVGFVAVLYALSFLDRSSEFLRH